LQAAADVFTIPTIPVVTERATVPLTIKVFVKGVAPARISFVLLSKSTSTLPKASAICDADDELFPEVTVAVYSTPGFRSSTSTDALDRAGLFVFWQVNTSPALALATKQNNRREESVAKIDFFEFIMKPHLFNYGQKDKVKITDKFSVGIICPLTVNSEDHSKSSISINFLTGVF
jgi:hypothetical protein